ncbi:ComEC/Rec2 family competence protein [Mycoplasmopsis felifaucium]|uniref:ComEC/Rec2 family competence protein n=2 Tax=Mycoplasmopsis felifaucium TaxID=35768 RepID=A0ABZ2RRL4_9BACT
MNYKYSLIVFILCALYLINFIITKFNAVLFDGNYEIEGLVLKQTSKYFIVSNKNENILVFKKNFSEVGEGYRITIQGFVTRNLENIKLDNTFIQSNNIKYFIQRPHILEIQKSSYNIFNNIENYGSQYKYFKWYWKTTVFGIYDTDTTLIEMLKKLNVIHLVVISGIHFDLLVVFLFFIFKPATKKSRVFSILIFIFLFSYLTLLKSFMSGLRAITMQATRHVNKQHNKTFQPLDGWLVAAFIIFLLNNNNVFSLSFILTFSCSLSAILVPKILSNIPIKQSYKNILLCVIIYIILLPFMLKINKWFNFLGIFLAILLLPLFELTFICSILFFWNTEVLNLFYKMVHYILEFLSNNTPTIKNNLEISWIPIFLNLSIWCVVVAIINKIKKPACAGMVNCR